jgi:Flp pilus assembly protein TadG
VSPVADVTRTTTRRQGVRHRLRSDGGFQALEMAFLFPVVVLFAFLAVGAGRSMSAKNEVLAAAHAGARAATLAVPGAEAGAADAEARRSLSQGSSHCQGAASISVSTRDFNGVTLVRTTVTCTVLISDIGLPFNQTVSGSAEESVDHDRS